MSLQIEYCDSTGETEMRIGNFSLINALMLGLVAAIFVSCTPTSTNVTPTIIGCSAGGSGVLTPEDVRCHLDQTDLAQRQRIDEETIVLLAEPQSISDWAGAAIIYHIPTGSMLVLDKFGDADPQASIFSSRAGLAALSELSGNPELMAGLKQQLQLKWQTSPSNEPEIRLGTAWQDGTTTIFFIAIAGLESTDDRFYCPSQTWTIGDSIEEIASDCIAHEAGTPVSHFFFEAKNIKGINERQVQIALNGLPSNVVQVNEGTVAQETLVYQAVLQQLTSRPLLLRSETAAGFDTTDQLSAAVDSSLLQNYGQANETPFSLRFLFYNSNVYGVHSSAAIERDFLQTIGEQSACDSFRSTYPGLGGVVTLSRIGYSDDGAEALVHALYECGPDDRVAAYYTLAAIEDGWQVTNRFAAVTELPALVPEMVFVDRAGGCGDLFVYQSNRAGTEYIYVTIDARAFDLSVTPVTLDLAAHPETIGSRIEVYTNRPDQHPYCNDVSQTEYPQAVWQAVSGMVTVSATASAPTEPCVGEPYQATVLMENIVFTLEEETVLLPSLVFNDVQVGWCPG